MTEVFVSSSNCIRLAQALPARRTVWVSCSRAAHTQGWGGQVSLMVMCGTELLTPGILWRVLLEGIA